MIHVVVMKRLIGLPLLIHIELLWRSRESEVLKIEESKSEFLCTDSTALAITTTGIQWNGVMAQTQYCGATENWKSISFKLPILAAQTVDDRHIRLTYHMKMCYKYHALHLTMCTTAFVLMCVITHRQQWLNARDIMKQNKWTMVHRGNNN
jgi:hypothetical protein